MAGFSGSLVTVLPAPLKNEPEDKSETVEMVNLSSRVIGDRWKLKKAQPFPKLTLHLPAYFKRSVSETLVYFWRKKQESTTSTAWDCSTKRAHSTTLFMSVIIDSVGDFCLLGAFLKVTGIWGS